MMQDSHELVHVSWAAVAISKAPVDPEREARYKLARKCKRDGRPLEWAAKVPLRLLPRRDEPGEPYLFEVMDVPLRLLPRRDEPDEPYPFEVMA